MAIAVALHLWWEPAPPEVKEIEIYISDAPILDGDVRAPTARLSARSDGYRYEALMENGDFLYYRYKYCNAAGCSAFSPQKSAQLVHPLLDPPPHGLISSMSWNTPR